MPRLWLRGRALKASSLLVAGAGLALAAGVYLALHGDRLPVGGTTSAAHPAVAPLPVAAAPPPPSDAQVLAQEAQLQIHEMDAAQARFQQEPTDAAWSARVSARIEDALAGFPGAPAGARDLECRSRTCRVEIASPPAGAQDGADPLLLDKSLPLLVMPLAGSLQSMTSYKVDDGARGTRTVLYFLRD